MKIRIIAIGKIKEDYLKEGINEYIKRIRPYSGIEIVELKDEPLKENPSLAEIKKAIDIEGDRVIKILKPSDYVIALDLNKKQLNSEGFAEYLDKNLAKSGSFLSFVIGGSYGLSDSLKERCNDSLSLSAALDDIESRFDKEWKIQDNVFDLTISGYLINGNLHASSASDFFDYLNALDNKVRSDVNKSFIQIDQNEIETIIRIKHVEHAVKKAMNNNFEGFVLNYQPIYQVASKKFDHLEVLLRFKDDELGNISPAEFIPIIERCGLAQRIDKFVLDSSCEFLVRHPEIDSVDINISGADFLNNPSAEFAGIVKKYGIDPKRICFEVTETATVVYPEIFEEFMQDMILEGFTFAIDDFGTGYSNIARITDKSFSLIKLDMSFLTGNEKMTKILETIVDLLHKLQIPMVIEGVETKEQLEYVKSLGIEYIQGWYFSKALPEKEFIEFINK